MATNLGRRGHRRGVIPDRHWWIGAALMFALGSGSAMVWWFGQTFPALWPRFPGLLP